MPTATKARPSLSKAAKKNVVLPPNPEPTDQAQPPETRVEWIPLDQVDRDGQNHRVETPTSKAKIKSLAADFAHGPAAQLQAVRVYERENLPYLLGFGFRRVAAAELAGWTHIRAEVLPMPADRSEVERVRAVENLQRDDLTPIEEMIAVLAYIDALPTHDFYTAAGKRGEGAHDETGAPLLATRDDDGKLQPWAVEHVAAAVGRDARWLRDRLYLERLGPKTRRRLIEGKLLLGHARELAKLGDHATQERLADWCEVRDDGTCHMMLDQLRRHVGEHQRSLKVVPWKLDQPFDGVKDKRILGACETCPHNSANDKKLFEHDDQPTDGAFCMHDACFEAKQAATNKAVEKAVATIVRKELPATEASATSVAAEYVKPGRVAREAKKAKDAGREPAADGGGDAGAAPAADAPQETSRTPEEEAGIRLDTALGVYEEKANEACAQALMEKPERLAAFAILSLLPAFGSYEIDKDALAEHADVIHAAICATQDDLIMLAGRAADAARKANSYDRNLPLFDNGTTPPAEFLRLLVDGWGLGLKYPTLEDFLPKPKPAAAVAKETLDGPLPAKVKLHKFDNDVDDVLRTAQVEGNKLILTTGTLDRKLYAKVNKAIELMGGKWNRMEEAHVFADVDPAAALAAALDDGSVVDRKQTFQFFETPRPLAERMVELAEIGPDTSVLEPSAGRGAIARAIRDARAKHLECCELDDQNRNYLGDKGFAVVCGDFLEWRHGDYDRIVMNPPFTRGQDIDHVRHAFDLLKPGGRLVAIVSSGAFHRQDAKATAFRDWLGEVPVDLEEDLPPETFAESGTKAQTKLLVLHKPTSPVTADADFAEEAPILDPKDLDVTEREIFAADAMKALDRMGDKPPKVKVVSPLLGDTQSRFGIAARIGCVVLGTVQCRGQECARLVPTVPIEDWVGDTVFGGAARARVAAGMFDGIQVRVGNKVEVIDEAKWILHVRVGKGAGHVGN